jgi:hypothetical protein
MPKWRAASTRQVDQRHSGIASEAFADDGKRTLDFMAGGI